MEKRKMSTTGIDMPLLGMGLMRMPTLDDGNIDEAQSLAMVDRMYGAGVRYFDTAYVYMGGESEKFAKRALVNRYPRESFYLATKLPGNRVKEEGDNEKLFSESCARMGVDYVDFYLLHGIDYDGWTYMKKMGCVDFQQRLKDEGRIKYAGFSFHGPVEDLNHILAEKSDWDFIQLMINYLDWYTDTAKELYEIVSNKNIPIVVMEPVRGGALANPGKDVSAVLEAARPEDSAARWAMRWVGGLPGVNVVLSGVSELYMAEDNAEVYSPLEPISDAEEDVIKSAVEIIQSRPAVKCTGCRYCCPCPAGVDIPAIFEASNAITRLYNEGHAKWMYTTMLKPEQLADRCIKCGECVPKCPQFIDIPAELEKCHGIISKVLE